MRLHRFFTAIDVVGISPIQIPSPELLNQLKNVLRLKVGDQVILFDGSGWDFLVAINSYHHDFVSFSLVEKRENKVHPERETYLFASVIKKANFEWLAEKATELGVSHIIPIISERSEKKAINSERLQKIVTEAAEQSGRATLPKLHEVMDLSEALVKFKDVPSIVWEPTAQRFAITEIPKVSAAFIGPEGGWTQAELELFQKSGIISRSLGPQILRAETAVIAVLSLYVF